MEPRDRTSYVVFRASGRESLMGDRKALRSLRSMLHRSSGASSLGLLLCRYHGHSQFGICEEWAVGKKPIASKTRPIVKVGLIRSGS